MAQYRLMSWNIGWMNNLFENNAVKPSEQAKAQKIASVIQAINPHVLGICEAANAQAEHDHFIGTYLPGSGYRAALGASRGAQNLVYYYRPPIGLVSIDDAVGEHGSWEDDVDDDGLREKHDWERKPLEAVFELGAGGPRARVILVHTKSKAIFDVVELHDFERIAFANRKRLAAQAYRLRARIDGLVGQGPLVVMGDMNDGPGLDAFERMLGRSFMETATGSVYDPAKILHNSLWWMTAKASDRDDLYTVEFPDPIVKHPQGWKHRVWLDHILVSPDMRTPAGTVRYVADSGRIGTKDATSRAASDHFAVYCDVET